MTSRRSVRCDSLLKSHRKSSRLFAHRPTRHSLARLANEAIDLGAELKHTVVRPSAAVLVESLRDIGYSLETAVADIIDNSISAHATKIDVWCATDVNPLALAIVDDGRGMSEVELIDAMRPGSLSPKVQRSAGDLGRFGLGLKTASFSQGRRLTVVSRKDGTTSGAAWDLDWIGDQQEWSLGLLEADDVSRLPWIETLGSTGTLVVWEKLDRLAEDVEGAARSDLIAAKIVDLSRHLSLVFHRFIEGTAPNRQRVNIAVNGQQVVAFDPFCRAVAATQKLPPERVPCDGEEIEIRAYILPHHSKLSPETLRFYRDRSDFLSNQGAYIYRDGRLMAWGEWFRMIPRSEATKLARVQIDFPCALDHLWTIDIKKSRAHPPPAVRAHFRRIIERIADRSVRVHRGRGEAALDRVSLPLWSRTVDRGSIRYSPDLDHPLLAASLSAMPEGGRKLLEKALIALGASFPTEALYTDFASEPEKVRAIEIALSDDEMRAQLEELKTALGGPGQIDDLAFARLALSMKVFGNDYERIVRLAA
jgi:hypothetical protein